ncbi:MAG: FtsX-like permease family protein [Sedimentisphaerales bacterium]|nr:FtsX-like permease family protein [Sedimentisphaerales bacterium]
MSLWRLIKNSLVFYWRTNVGVLLAVAVSTAVLTGALVVGDSVRHSLMVMADERLGRVQLALVAQNRFFKADLADELSAELNADVAPVLQLRGLIANSDDTALANRVEVLGVDERFFGVGARSGDGQFRLDWGEGVVLNEPLAERLGVGVGDEVKMRIEKPGLMPREVPLTPDSDLSFFARLTVKAVAGRSQFGRFSLQANQIPPLNVFVPIRWLQENLGQRSRANILLVAAGGENDITVEKADAAIRKRWRLGDAGLELRTLRGRQVLEMRSSRVFIDRSLTDAAMRIGDNAVGVLTYFVDELRRGPKSAPYSTVAAMTPAADGVIPHDMQDDEILINQWLADDVGAKVGDSMEIAYSVIGSMKKLEKRKSSFVVRDILPMERPAMDPNLMPEFPGLADVDNCRDWEPGITIDLDEIRDKDEEYWNRYRGTPKAFVTLAAGQAMWANRYGNMTAVRYPLAAASEEQIAQELLAKVDPGSVGLFFQPVRQRGAKAGSESSYFGWLFLGLSFFLIAAAVVLTGLLFVFGVEGRSEQIGTLLALGFSPKLIRLLLIAEGGLVALLGAIAGTGAALLYTKVMVVVLSSVTQGSAIYFYVKTTTLIAGASAAVVISLCAIWLTLRRQVSMTTRELLSGAGRWQFFGASILSRGKTGFFVAVAAVIGAVVLPVMVGSEQSTAVAGAFFGSGAMLLTAGIAFSSAVLKVMAGSGRKPLSSLVGLGLRNCSRRTGRSLAVVALLACGIFLVIAVEVFRHDPLAHAERRDSGTGGFALYGESAIGILHDLNSDEGRRSMLLDSNVLEGVEIVQMRVRDGDDASCFNLNRAQTPRLLGVRSVQLLNRGSFSFASTRTGIKGEAAWDLLNDYEDDNIVPAVGDIATITWALGKSLGDDIEYSDEKGRKFSVRLVGMLGNSILQGSLLIAESQFIKRFPSEDGYRLLLVDAPPERIGAVAEHLSSRLTDFGLGLSSARQRLAAFGRIESTYISIFEILGGLGLVLGSVGLGLVVLRNMLERRNELAMLQAVGFNKASLKRMIFYEHSGLMLAGLVCGAGAALIAVAPALKAPAGVVPYVSLSFTVAAIALSGIVWIWIATVLALRGAMLDALRSE